MGTAPLEIAYATNQTDGYIKADTYEIHLATA